ncbi:MAG: hemolysin family protein [Propionibacteriaceae bacterium]
MSGVLPDILLILLFIVLSGFFVAAEMALVSLRDSQVKAMAQRGGRGAVVQRVIANPNRFLSAVQLGVTLTGFLSAAFGGATLANDLSPVLRSWGLSSGLADAVALVGITALISYVSIVLGELTAKRLALQRSEGFALALAPLVDGIARVVRPVIWLLGVSTNVVVRILGGDPGAAREQVSDEEIRAMVSGSQTLGAEERQIVDDVFDAGSRGLREVMVPRTEVDFLPGDLPTFRAVRDLRSAPHSRYPVTGDSADDIIGFVHVRDLFDPEMSTRSTPVSELARPVLSLPDTVRVLRALTDMRRASAHLAIVLDEYGGTAGIVTMEDLVEELIGDITDEYDVVAVEPVHAVGERVLDGLCTIDGFAELTGYELPEGPYDTVAGFVVARLGHIPAIGDTVLAEGVRVDRSEETEPLELRVTELDGRRAAQILVRRAESAERPDPAGGTADPGSDPRALEAAATVGGTDQAAHERASSR